MLPVLGSPLTVPTAGLPEVPGGTVIVTELNIADDAVVKL
jgi:hypothetical protein